MNKISYFLHYCYLRETMYKNYIIIKKWRVFFFIEKTKID